MRTQIDGMFFTLTHVRVVCSNFAAFFFIAFIAVLFGGAATFAAFAAFIAVLFFATFIAFIAMARRLAGKMR